ncbi:MAG: DUF3794 domain-containing protein [Clostridia bacterium]|nr:DUF3794 domain-containing protein [Clostridia bacterium]
MNFETKNDRLGFCETVLDCIAEQSVDADISLPDYCSDIKRILRCSAVASANSVSVARGRVTCDASATVKIIYVDSEDKINAYEQECPFQKYIENSSVDESCAVSVNIKTDYVNCRAISPRRINVHASLACSFRADKRRTESILSFAQGEGIQCKCKKCKTVDIVGKAVRVFPMSEVVELPAEKPCVSKILNIHAIAVGDDIRVITNKMLVKGTLDIHVYYLSENSTVERYEHSMPVSQILEMEGLSEDCISRLDLTVAGAEALPKVDSSGEMKLLDIMVNVQAKLSSCRKADITLVEDAYSTCRELKCETKSIELCEPVDSYSETFLSKSTVDSPSTQPDAVLAVWCSRPVCTANLKEGFCVVSGSYECSVIFRDMQGEYGFVSKQIDFEHKHPISGSVMRIRTNTCVKILNCSCAVTADSGLEIKTEMLIDADVYSLNIEKYVSCVETGEASQNKRAAALTVYFSDAEESVWNIAKRYNTTVKAVMEENSLEGEFVPCSKMLLIPVVDS